MGKAAGKPVFTCLQRSHWEQKTVVDILSSFAEES